MSRKKDAERLLYAMTDVDDQYIEEASQYYSSRRKTSAHWVLVFRRAAGIAAALAACFTIVLILGQNGALLRRSGSQSIYDSVNSTADQAAAESAQEDTASGTAAAINPYQEVDSLDDAAEITGFKLTVPNAGKTYPLMTINVVDQTVIEVDYTSEDGMETGYSIRKAEGSDDISGDYNDYAATRIKEMDGMEVTLKGDGQTWSVATWAAGGYTYAIDAQEHPLTEEQITELVSGTQ